MDTFVHLYEESQIFLVIKCFENNTQIFYSGYSKKNVIMGNIRFGFKAFLGSK